MANTEKEMKQFEFLGFLMGCAFRTQTYLILSLPALFWKSFTEEKPSFEDLYEIDIGLKTMATFINTCTEQEFKESFFETFECLYTCGQSVDLVENGKEIPVSYSDRFKYLDLLT